MRVISCELKNFASYEHLEFNFDDKGLSLVAGSTGSGKSTLCDAIPWILFGKTAKGGTVDEVLTWPGDQVTYGSLKLDSGLSIYRVRGPKAKDNDLYYSTALMQIARGKDIQDTQRLLNAALGLNAELYLAGAYFHEFSQTAQFFTTTAKNRRTICEQLVDLSMAMKLHLNVGLANKETKDALVTAQSKISNAEIEYKTLDKMYQEEIKRADAWASKQSRKEAELTIKYEEFEDTMNTQAMALKTKIHGIKAKPDIGYLELINALRTDMPPELAPCKECGVPKASQERESVVKQIQFLEKCRAEDAVLSKERDYLCSNLKTLETSENTYGDQIKALLEEKNPHTQTAEDLKQEIHENVAGVEILTKDKQDLQIKQSDLEILEDVAKEFRGILIKNTMLDIESKTNLLLSNHFDAEIKIELLIEDADKLNVTIQKDGNTCSYSQLSKGQRQILKLCFGTSVMKSIANHHSLKFSQIFLDEALDGLDDNMKMKAVHMLETLTLEYDSIYLVEHSETVKASIDNKYKVGLVDGKSQITKET